MFYVFADGSSRQGVGFVFCSFFYSFFTRTLFVPLSLSAAANLDAENNDNMNNFNINFAGPAEADAAYEGIIEYVPIRARVNETPKRAAWRLAAVVIDAVKAKLNMAGIEANSGRYRLAAVQYDEDHGYYAHLFFTMARIRENDLAIRELAHFMFEGHTLTTRENGRVIVNIEQLNRVNAELAREREHTRAIEREAQLERERKRRVEKELAESRLAEQEGLRREEKQRETISKLEAKIAAIELDIAAHRLMARTRASPPAPPTTTIPSHYGSFHALAPASTTRAPWRGPSALGRGRASTSTTSTTSSTTPPTTPPPQAAASQSTTTATTATPPLPPTTARTSDDDEETGEEFEDDLSITFPSHF